MTKVNNMLTETLMACPAERISRGQISLGTNHPNGPQDHAKAATYVQIKNNIKLASNLDKVPSPVTPNFRPIMMPTAIYIWNKHICMQIKNNKKIYDNNLLIM